MTLLTLPLFFLFSLAFGFLSNQDPYTLGDLVGSSKDSFRVPPGTLLYLKVPVPIGYFTDPNQVDNLRWKTFGQLISGDATNQAYYAENQNQLSLANSSNDAYTFQGVWFAPKRETLQLLEWTVYQKDGTPQMRNGRPLVVKHFVYVSCSNGLFCDGIERWNGEECLEGSPACEDDEDCTIDECSEERGGRCIWSLKNASCAPCGEFQCISDCSGKQCGDNGCGGSCGDCKDGEGCNRGSCEIQSPGGTGTCERPFELFPNGTEFSLGSHTYLGDTSSGVNLMAPSCNVLSDAKESLIHFRTPATGPTFIGGMFIVKGGENYSAFDTVLEILEGSCDGDSLPTGVNPAAIGCADDSTPPGNFGSKVEVKLKLDTDYYIHVDGYSSGYAGPFELTVVFRDACVPACDSNFCGPDGCGGLCGICESGFACNQDDLRCYVTGCIPNCLLEDGVTEAMCGFDGCGGSCGNCATNTSCDYDPSNEDEPTLTGECPPSLKRECDAYNPVCLACNATEYCGGDCECHAILGNYLPDLVVDIPEVYIESGLVFSDRSCAVKEMCATPETDKVLRMTIRSVNLGFADMNLPEIKEFGHLFEFSPCHNHWHFYNYARYLLFDTNGVVVAAGGKMSYCLEDSGALVKAPWVECSPIYDCGSQGILRGWTDEYGAALDCQWLDITGVKDGDYRLEVRINYGRNSVERTNDNNYAALDIVINGGDVTFTPVKDVVRSWSDYDTELRPVGGANSLVACLGLTLCLLISLFA